MPSVGRILRGSLSSEFMSLSVALLLRFARWLLGLAFAVSAAAALALGLFTLSLLPELPTVESFRDVPLKVPLRVYSQQGGLIAEFGEERREPVAISDVPQPLIDAVLAAEDDGFYRHPGIDPVGIARAALANFRARTREQGASTITMQVARNFFLSREKTYTRKLKEMLLAFRLEQVLSKDEILELYLNKIFLGHRAYGFGAAARVYYGKPLAELTLPEMAMLAGLPKAPSRDNPLTSPENARQRRNYVLDRMLKLEYIDATVHAEAAASPLTAAHHTPERALNAPYVAEMVRGHMVDTYGEQAYWGGYKVFTTLNERDQATADQALRDGLLAYERRHGYRGPVARHAVNDTTSSHDLDTVLADVFASGDVQPAVVLAVDHRQVTAYTKARDIVTLDWSGLSWARRYQGPNRKGPEPQQASDVLAPGDVVYVHPSVNETWKLVQLPAVAGALVSLRPNDGAVLALTGGFDFYASKFNRATQAARQPGSNIKPFIYAAALDRGFTPASLVSGAPIVVEDDAQETLWRPENYSGKFTGPTRLRRALSLSLNLVSVRLVRALGAGAVRDYLQEFGFDKETLPAGLSLSLGAGAVTPMTMARAYAVFANGGYLIEPYVIDWIESADGRTVRPPRRTVCGSCVASSPWTVRAAEALQTPGWGWAPRILDPGTHFLITSMMSDVIRTGTGRRALSLKRNDLAGKTGTTNDFRDAWFSGFNRDVVTTVWVGFDSSTTLGRGEAGSRAALPIWIDYMKVALGGSPERWFTMPDNVVFNFVDRETGRPVPESHPNAYREVFLAGSIPPPTAHPGGARPAAATSAVPEGLF